METPGDCIVVDAGSGIVKAGFAGESRPRLTRVRWHPHQDEPSSRQAFVGGSTGCAGGGGELWKPLEERGGVADWDCAQLLWTHVVTAALGVNPADHPLIMTEPALSPKASRERTVEIMIEGVGCAGIYLAVPGTLALFATGRTSGAVIDIGYQQTTVMSVFQGHQLRPGTQTLPLGGYDLTMYLLRALVARGYPFTPAAYDAINTVKEKLCYVSENFERDLSTTLNNDKPDMRRVYALPDGSTVTVDKERFMTPEVLFKPTLIERSFPGLGVVAVRSIIRSNFNIHDLLFDNVMLTGGATCTERLEPRLQQEMLLVAPPTTKIQYIETKQSERPLLAWMGGAMMGKLATFEDAYVRRWEYDEYGSSIVHRKCF